MKRDLDYLIVGQGIAGTILSAQLILEGYRVMVVDRGFKKSASWVAAGVVNPLVLKRLTVTWRAEDFLAFNKNFYSALEKLLGGKYIHYIPLYKLIHSEDEKNFWSHRFNKAGLGAFINREFEEKRHLNDLLAREYEIGNVKNCAWVDLKKLLSDFRKLLINQNSLIEEHFDFDCLDSNSYKQLSFNKIIFCEGAQAVHNPYFNYLPFSLNKGELITINSKELKQKEILKKKVFLLPIGDDNYKVGATYAWKWKSEEPTEEKRADLKEMLSEITSVENKIIEHEAGVRPAVKDRRPLIGLHPTNPFYIFNGLGSRGCLMAPLLAKELISHIEKGKAINPECNIDRYKEKAN